MASKRSRRGRHPPSETAFNSKVQRFRDIAARFERARQSPKSSVQLYGGGDRERDLRTWQWRTARIQRFIEIQQCKREWINFWEIAEWCSEESSVVPNEVAREAAYQKLQRDLLEGDFEENIRSRVRSRVLYLYPYTSKARMTRDWLTRLMEVYDQSTINSQYLAPCWIPREFLERWLAKHRMQARPQRFEPKWPTPPARTRQSVTPPKAVVPPVIAEGVADGASDAARKGRFGPEPGTLRRYDAADRKLFPELERIMAEEKKSRTAAALALASRIAGAGTDQSRAMRLARLYKRERGGTR
jgi:hypothetical protein